MEQYDCRTQQVRIGNTRAALSRPDRGGVCVDDGLDSPKIASKDNTNLVGRHGAPTVISMVVNDVLLTHPQGRHVL